MWYIVVVKAELYGRGKSRAQNPYLNFLDPSENYRGELRNIPRSSFTNTYKRSDEMAEGITTPW
jgi:hypothetical protein